MVNPVNGGSGLGRGLYAEQVKRQAWREEMLKKMLDTVRDNSQHVSGVKAAMGKGGPPNKGTLLDVVA